MGRTNDDTVETRPSNDPGSVKRSQLRKFYDAGHSPQETADEFNVEVATVVEVLGLNENPGNEAPAEPAADPAAEE